VAVLNSFVRYFGRYLLTVISQETVQKIRQDAFDNLQRLPVKYYDQNQPGTIVSRLTNDVELISNSLSQVTSQLIASAITLLGSLIMMFIVNWALSLMVLAFVPLMIFITAKIGKKTKKGFIAQQKHLGNLNGIIEESISGMDIVKLYSLQPKFEKHFDDTNDKLKHASFKAQFFAGIVMPIINFLNNLIYVFIVFVGGLIKILGWAAITIGDISAISQYARQFVQPISNLAQLFNTLQQGLAGAERVFELIDEETEYETDGDAVVEHLKGHVVFNDVTFGYEPDKTVLKNISFDAEKGKIIAIVGPTGSGKTTIINLLNRFYDINHGTIEVDGKNIKSYLKDDYRKRVGVVLQDTSLFSGTVYENIHYGNQMASKEDVIEASKLANAHDFIMKLPDGYDAPIFEGGKNFSHGERQLISIARTILSNPDILILDEATSNVDTRTEFRIQESMKVLMQNRTSFVIAHRLQTIRDAHKIIVIKDGELIESGHHDDLLHEKGFYYDLYTTQFKDLIIE
jgi:ATP-binding cassette subfamily B protein